MHMSRAGLCGVPTNDLPLTVRIASQREELACSSRNRDGLVDQGSGGFPAGNPEAIEAPDAIAGGVRYIYVARAVTRRGPGRDAVPNYGNTGAQGIEQQHTLADGVGDRDQTIDRRQHAPGAAHNGLVGTSVDAMQRDAVGIEDASVRSNCETRRRGRRLGLFECGRQNCREARNAEEAQRAVAPQLESTSLKPG